MVGIAGGLGEAFGFVSFVGGSMGASGRAADESMEAVRDGQVGYQMMIACKQSIKTSILRASDLRTSRICQGS